MLRLRFDVNDLARTTFTAPFPLCEVAGSIEAVQRPASRFHRLCRASDTRFPTAARALLGLVPAHAGVPEFLAPERTGSLDELLEAVRTTPAKHLNEELSAIGAGSPPSPWARDLAAGRPQAVRHLGEALRSWHDHVVAPHWPSLQQAVTNEVAQRAWQWGTQGADRTLNTLHPSIRWRDGVLEVASPVSAEVDLDGRGLRLVPSAVWARPVLALGWEQPSLTYPISPNAEGVPWGEARPDGLVGLIGGTRSRVLRLLATGEDTTTGLATELGISPASASSHAKVLRTAGLVTSRRHGREMRHTLTELGHRLTSSPYPSDALNATIPTPRRRPA